MRSRSPTKDDSSTIGVNLARIVRRFRILRSSGDRDQLFPAYPPPPAAAAPPTAAFETRLIARGVPPTAATPSVQERTGEGDGEKIIIVRQRGWGTPQMSLLQECSRARRGESKQRKRERGGGGGEFATKKAGASVAQETEKTEGRRAQPWTWGAIERHTSQLASLYSPQHKRDERRAKA